jgi:CHAT domain-containing protein/tetratricopeptide (TPR) repeat protein
MNAISAALFALSFLDLQPLAAPVAAHDPASNEWRQAEHAFAEGERLRSQGTAKAVAAALERYRAAATAWQRLNVGAREAVARNRIGWAMVYLGEHAAAVAPYEEALCLARAAAVSSEAGLSLHGLGWIYDKLGDPDRSLQFYEAALGESVPTTLRSTIMTGMANHHLRLGEADEALGLFHDALELERSTGDRNGEAITLWSLSVFHRERGEWQKAIELHRQMLSIYETLRSKAGISYALRELGATYHGWGMNDRALDYLQRALGLTREVGDRVGEAIILSRMGSVYRDQHDLTRAIDAYQQALRIYETTIHYDASTVLVELGRAYMMAGKLDLALDCLERSFQINRKSGRKPVEAKALQVLGDVHLRAGDTERAVARYREALELYRSISNPAGEASMLYASAKAQAQAGRLSDARHDIEMALNIIENLRSSVISRELRTSYFASVRQMYEFQIDLLMRLHRGDPAGGFDLAAFTASERARARSLLEVLTEARADIRKGIAPQLLQRERTLQQLVGSRINRRMRLLSGNHSPQQIEAITREIDRLTAEYETVQEEIRKTSPRYASLMQPEPTTISALRRLLGMDTVLVEYFLGQSRSFLWAVTGEKLVSHELPRAATIEAAAAALYKGASGSRAGMSRATEQMASELGKMLLGPIAGVIDGKRLVVVADGPLQYVPFAALGMPDPALNRHEITYAPSASALVSLRPDLSSRLEPPKTLAVLADPVFDAGDERVTARMAGVSLEQRRRNRERETPSDLDMALRDAEIDDGAIVRLPFTRREANAILPLVPETKRRVALDFDASRALALSDELADYRIIHFATHALLDSTRPEFSGIVLSLVDRNGRDQDGFLAATEVFNLKLRAALVVLSGCRTALGQDVRGEGLVGLTRGFMYAGAPRVVATLWKVDDAATAELMKHFYEGMFGPRKLLPAAALRQAQRSLANTPRWNAPYYWAAFVLHGEWN